jgi:hypothetical protein
MLSKEVILALEYSYAVISDLLEERGFLFSTIMT